MVFQKGHPGYKHKSGRYGFQKGHLGYKHKREFGDIKIKDVSTDAKQEDVNGSEETKVKSQCMPSSQSPASPVEKKEEKMKKNNDIPNPEFQGESQTPIEIPAIEAFDTICATLGEINTKILEELDTLIREHNDELRNDTIFKNLISTQRMNLIMKDYDMLLKNYNTMVERAKIMKAKLLAAITVE